MFCVEASYNQSARSRTSTRRGHAPGLTADESMNQRMCAVVLRPAGTNEAERYPRDRDSDAKVTFEPGGSAAAVVPGLSPPLNSSSSTNPLSHPLRRLSD